LKRDIEQLGETIRELQRMLVRGSLPDYPILHERSDGTEDVERFAVKYGCTPEQALERGAVMLVVMRHFGAPQSTVGDESLRQTLREPHRRDHVPPDPVVAPHLPPTGAGRPEDGTSLEPSTRQS
jgi:hypothetical protein